MCARHGRDTEVQVLRGSWSQRPQVNRKADTVHEDGAERSGERTCVPTNRNRIGGVVSQGERAIDRKALATKGTSRKSGGGAGKVTTLTRGGLASCLKGQRGRESRSEESAEAIVAVLVSER